MKRSIILAASLLIVSSMTIYSMDYSIMSRAQLQEQLAKEQVRAKAGGPTGRSARANIAKIQAALSALGSTSGSTGTSTPPPAGGGTGTSTPPPAGSNIAAIAQQVIDAREAVRAAASTATGLDAEDHNWVKRAAVDPLP